MRSKLPYLGLLALLVAGCGGSGDSTPAGSGATLYFVTNGDTLVTTRENTPGTVRQRLPIFGLDQEEDIVGIDVRPATGELFALADSGRLFTIDTVTGDATQVGSGSIGFDVSGGPTGFDFNPTVDRIRVVKQDGTNFRVNPITGAGVDGNPGAEGLQPDTAINPGGFTITGVGYSNNVGTATTTTMYAIDTQGDRLVRVGGLDGPPSPNLGGTTAIGSLGVNVADTASSFDITPTGLAYATFISGNRARVYSIQLSTGAATELGALPASDGTVTAFAVRN